MALSKFERLHLNIGNRQMIIENSLIILLATNTIIVICNALIWLRLRKSLRIIAAAREEVIAMTEHLEAYAKALRKAQ